MYVLCGTAYTFSADALALYDDFDSEIVNILNNKWHHGLLVKEKLCILLDKFTESGLRQHLIQQQGVAAIVKDEMYEILGAIIVEREMGTLYRLYDGDSISVNTENSASESALRKLVFRLEDLFRW